jgi:hypothetical protein
MMTRALVAALCLVFALPAEPQFNEDAFDLQVNIGRRGIFIDRAMTAADIELPFVIPADTPEDPQAPDALWRALRETAREGAILRELYCAKKLTGPAVCRRRAPGWISADPNPTPTLAVIRERLDELDAFLAPYIDKGCTMGRKKSGDDLFCSVE